MSRFRFRRTKAADHGPDTAIDTVDSLKHLLEIGKLVLAESDVDRLLTVAMDRLVESSGSERGMIILFDEGGQILFETARNLDKQDIDRPEFEISRTIIDKVKGEKKSVCLRNALEDPELQKSKSAYRLKILSVICLPLRHDDRIFGVIYLDNRTVQGAFKREIFTFSETFADFVSLAAHHALERKRLANHVQALEKELRGRYEFEAIIGHHPKMVEILKRVARIADSDATVLLYGESGTGKELIARALHYNSSRRDKPFIPINCGALPENLLESELFGHVRGAFTDAIKDKTGWFERADGGTFFLDEVSAMPQALQVKLLRVLQTGEYNRVGSTDIEYCDVRLVAATNKDLWELVKDDKFREDLYYRLKVVDVELPPLRDRKSDIPLLIQHFIKSFAAKSGKENLHMTEDAESMLMAYDFPGNVRELENIIQGAVVLAESDAIEPQHLPDSVQREEPLSPRKEQLGPFKETKQDMIENFERNYLVDCLKATKGNISRAAQIAGITYRNFYDKITKYGIDPNAFK